MAPTKRGNNNKCASVQNGRVEKKKSPVKVGGGPAKAAMTALQRIPSETLLDALVHLDRGQLETLQLTSTHFKTIVETEMKDLCLRPIHEVCVSMNGNRFVVDVKAGATVGDPPSPSLEDSQEDAVRALVSLLRHAVVVGRFIVRDCQLTPRFLDAFRGFTASLRISGPGFLCVGDVSPASDVHRLLDAFESISAFVYADPLAMCKNSFADVYPVDAINDAVLRSCIARGVPVVNLPRVHCAVTEDAVLDWCFASDPTNRGYRFLELAMVHLSARFLERFVELHESTEHLNPLSLRIKVSRREFTLNAGWNVEQSNTALRSRRLTRPITHREDLKDSVVRLEIHHAHGDLDDMFDWRDEVLTIRRGVDSPLMDERFFGTIEEPREYVSRQDGLRYS